MRQFWDERAAENALYFVDNTVDYENPDTSGFWDRGRHDLDSVLNAVGAEISPADEVVEIGCGIGRLTRVLASRARHVRAVDVSPRMLELARQHGADLANVEWVLGDGVSLAPIADKSASACVSHVVFQHIPDPSITLGYVREIGRVLRPGGWAAFQFSNDPGIHRRRTGRAALRIGWRAVRGRGPTGQTNRAWLGSAVELEALRGAVAEGNMCVERITGEGTQFCLVLTRRFG